MIALLFSLIMIILLIYKVSKFGDCNRGRPEDSLFISYYTEVQGGAAPFLGLLNFTIESYLIMLSVKQGDIRCHFLSLWYDSIWDWTLVPRAVAEHSIHSANEPVGGGGRWEELEGEREWNKVVQYKVCVREREREREGET